MKTFKTLLVIGCLLILHTAQLSAQCPSKEFPYEFCDGNGRLITKCSADPHREKGLKPLRVSEPPCFVPVRQYEQKISITGFPGPSVIDVFDPYQALIDMNTAWNEWVSLCPNTYSGSPDNSYCCLRVSMSQNVFDFSDELSQLSSELVYTADHRTCRKYCNGPNLYLNFTDDFFYQDRDITEPMAIVWFTGSRSPRSDYYGLSCENVFSFKQHIEHVFGIHLGLVPRDRGGPCGDEHTVMGDALHETDANGLTDDDRCQFIKLYCPDQVGLEPALGVEEENHDVEGMVLSQNTPNPFSQMTTISYTITKGGEVSLRIFDGTGRDMKTLVDQHEEPGQYTYGFHADNDMPSGTYWYVLQVDGKTLTRQMILVK